MNHLLDQHKTFRALSALPNGLTENTIVDPARGGLNFEAATFVGDKHRSQTGKNAEVFLLNDQRIAMANLLTPAEPR